MLPDPDTNPYKSGFGWFLAFVLGIDFAPAFAQADDWLVVTIGSRHHKRGYNEHNWGAGIEHGINEDWRAIAGIYRNSFYRSTVYAGATYHPLRFGDWHAGGAIFLASGYERRPVVLPFPSVSYEQKNWGLNFGPILPTVIGVQVKFKVP